MASNAALKPVREQWNGTRKTRSVYERACRNDAAGHGNAAGTARQAQTGNAQVRNAQGKNASKQSVTRSAAGHTVREQNTALRGRNAAALHGQSTPVKRQNNGLRVNETVVRTQSNALRAQNTVVRGQNAAGRQKTAGRTQDTYLRKQNAAAGSDIPRLKTTADNRNTAVRQVQLNAVPEAQPKTRLFYDTSLLCAVIFIFALGLLIIYSSSQYTAQLERAGDSAYYFKRQLAIGGFGLICAIIVSFIDYRHYAKRFDGFAVKFAYLFAVGCLVATLIIGVASHGKTRWLSIFGVQFQPAEVAKIGLILYLSWYISKNIRFIKQREKMLHIIAAAALPTALILKQNISSAIIVALITAVMIFVAVDNKKIFALLGTIAGLTVFGLKPFLAFVIEKTGYSTRPDAYYLRRILGWAAPEVFPDDAYQTLQSLYAIGSGGITGHGLGESIQKFGKIPEVQNDMIFAIVCEEFGFLGAAMIIILFMYIIYRISIIAKNAEDLFGSLICTGVMAHIGIQTVLNIAVVTGVIPNTGVTLPFISYGGSAVGITMLEIGLVLSVAHRIPKQ